MNGQDQIWELTGKRKKMAGGGGDDGRTSMLAVIR
jgi:hypothetical protein